MSNAFSEYRDSFLIENWPTKSDAAADALQKIIDGGLHTVLPLPLYKNALLVKPNDYESVLKGTLVAVQFTLHSWTLAARKTDTFQARVKAIHPLTNRNPVKSPKKRKAALTDPSSPMKKAKTVINSNSVEGNGSAAGDDNE